MKGIQSHLHDCFIHIDCFIVLILVFRSYYRAYGATNKLMWILVLRSALCVFVLCVPWTVDGGRRVAWGERGGRVVRMSAGTAIFPARPPRFPRGARRPPRQPVPGNRASPASVRLSRRATTTPQRVVRESAPVALIRHELSTRGQNSELVAGNRWTPVRGLVVNQRDVARAGDSSTVRVGPGFCQAACARPQGRRASKAHHPPRW